MNPDKLNKWIELAKSFAGQDFWSDMLDQSGSQQDQFSHNPFFAGKPSPGPASLFPAADVLTSDHEMVVLVDLPGVAKEDIQLSIHDEILHIKGEAKSLYPQHTTVSSERFVGSFERPIGLPVRIDGQTTKIRATFHHGTLIIRIPLAPSRKKSIPID